MKTAASTRNHQPSKLKVSRESEGRQVQFLCSTDALADRPEAGPARNLSESDGLSPEIHPRNSGPLAARIDALTTPEPTSGCLLWTGSLIPAGYGMIKVGGRGRMAHRVSYELARGPISDGLELDHLCRNRACVEPNHLEPVTPAENNRRGFSAPAINARREECIRGHELSGENLYRSPDGHRHCRICTAESRARYYAKNRAAVIARAGAANRARRPSRGRGGGEEVANG